MPVCLSACLPVCLSAWLSASLPVCQSVSLPVCQSVCLSKCPFICLFVPLSVCLSVSQSVCTTLYNIIHLSVLPSVGPDKAITQLVAQFEKKRHHSRRHSRHARRKPIPSKSPSIKTFFFHLWKSIVANLTFLITSSRESSLKWKAQQYSWPPCNN